MGSYKYPLLNDEAWLRQKYLEEKLSTRVSIIAYKHHENKEETEV